jgi:ribonucleoside-diphosphate reductase alpha chain
MSSLASTIYDQKYRKPGEVWFDQGPGSVSTPRRVVEEVMGPYFPGLVEEMVGYISDRKFMPGGRYLYATGEKFHQTQNCLLMDVEDSRESWANLMERATNGLMTGAGIGVVYSKLRERGALVKGMGGTSTGPTALMQMVNEAGRHIMQGGSRRAAIWAGLHWNHPDVFEFIALKDWSDDIKAMKAKDFNFPAPMDGTNISVILDDEFFAAYNDENSHQHHWAHKVYWDVVEHMLHTGEPGFSIDVGGNAGEHLRNACTEVTSRDNNDICNLGSINMSRVESRDEMERITKVATAFLLCGTLYSKVPYQEVADVRAQNRRLGLGLMGISEWLAERSLPYAPNDELGQWLDAYAMSGFYADEYADLLGVSRPIKTRAIAPTGTIGILAETTTGIEPMFAKAYKRRYLKGSDWHFQYVVDSSAKRLVDKGVDPDRIEDAYDLAKDPARRLEFQAWVQQWVDHGISSTLNLPAKEEQAFSTLEFGNILMQYLPRLRGVTVYPDGARGGQPLTPVSYSEAAGWEGYEYAEVGNELSCVSGVCGI